MGTNFIINFHSEFNLSIFVCVKIWPKALKSAHRVGYQDM